MSEFLFLIPRLAQEVLGHHLSRVVSYCQLSYQVKGRVLFEDSCLAARKTKVWDEIYPRKNSLIKCTLFFFLCKCLVDERSFSLCLTSLVSLSCF